jgi:hypothetical protein
MGGRQWSGLDREILWQVPMRDLRHFSEPVITEATRIP